MHERPAMAPDAAPFVAAGKLIKQPGDGSCCFHTLVAGLAQIGGLVDGIRDAAAMRRTVLAWLISGMANICT